MRITCKLALAMAGLAFTGGCNGVGLFDADPPSDLTLGVTRSDWRQNDTARVVLRNDSDRPLGYNLCTKALERREGGQWRTVQSLPENTACTLQLYIMEPGDSAVGGLVLHPFIEPGTYRFRTTVEWPLSDGRRELVSNEFRVLEA